jgi:hypothetical protein
MGRVKVGWKGDKPATVIVAHFWAGFRPVGNGQSLIGFRQGAIVKLVKM